MACHGQEPTVFSLSDLRVLFVLTLVERLAYKMSEDLAVKIQIQKLFNTFCNLEHVFLVSASGNCSLQGLQVFSWRFMGFYLLSLSLPPSKRQ